MSSEARQLSGSIKAAILIRSMSEPDAAALLNRLTPEERDVVQRQLNQIGSLSPEVVDQVAREFTRMASHARGGSAALPQLPPAASPANASENDGLKMQGLAALKTLGPEDIFELIKDEHPQTMAVVLIHLKTSVASEIVSLMSDEIKADVAMRIANMDKVIASMVDDVNEIFKDILKNKKSTVTSVSGGVERLAEILNQADEISSELILNEIEEANAELAAQIKQKMFVFEDLVLVDDRGFQKLLRRVETKELAVALKAASEEVKNKVYRNMSERASEMLREEMDTLGPVRMKEVSDAQQAITAIIQEMEGKGEVIISGRRGEQIVS